MAQGVTRWSRRTDKSVDSTRDLLQRSRVTMTGQMAEEERWTDTTTKEVHLADAVPAEVHPDSN